MEDIQLPLIPPALVSALERIYPDKSADLSWKDREVWFRAGQASVVQFLKRSLEEQLEQTKVEPNVRR